MRALKQQNNALADEAASAKFKLVDAQQEQLKLKGQIVEVCRLCLLPVMVACPPISNWVSPACSVLFEGWTLGMWYEKTKVGC